MSALRALRLFASLACLSACSTDRAPNGAGPRASDGGSGDGGSFIAPADAGGGAPDASGGPIGGGERPKEGVAFPEGFVFGTAVAGFQVDMGCPTLARAECEDKASDWTVFTTDPRTVASDRANLAGQDPSVVGPGFWELYEEDIARAHEQLHNNALRLSIEWSRIFPEPTDDIEGFEALARAADAAAVKHYHDIFAALKARGMRPLVTLYHYALPTWIHDAAGCHVDFDSCSPRGWVDAERTLREITKLAAFCAREFGGEVDWWATLNEPLQNMLFGYVQPTEQRTHPPAVSLKAREAHVVFNALIEAHARMYDAVKEHDTVDVDGDGQASFIGVVYPLVPIHPNDPTSIWNDTKAAENIDYLWNRAYLNAVTLGQYDEKLDKNIVQREDLAGRMDYVGINYYFSMGVSGVGFDIPLLADLSPLFTANPLSFRELDNEPGELDALIAWVNEDLAKPVVITENGAVDPDDDGTGPRFLVQNLRALAESIQAGRDVRGYFYWTLIDNYEWNHGMNVQMGMYAVDKDDPMKARAPRQVVDVYGEIARFGVLPDVFVDIYDR